ncbi:ABC transporter substrate-binding protein [Halioxenophilus sp. WMMB6]|uniref:ABC transporter substrate-binding protein n=1 Tax=Halioxenophilus sp. WMMB6 TaxID=3073815 RepID=UPI00295F1D9C|nr:ABC transporter substrate-binding protein [Halioxenophilus sp. WMMB6]
MTISTSATTPSPAPGIGRLIRSLLVTVPLLLSINSSWAEPGIYPDQIVVGAVLDMEGLSRGLGLGMRSGLEAAFDGQRVQGKAIKLKALNDSYSPNLTVKATERLIADDIFAMIGNVGTPTAQVSLPILAENGVPAIGFFTGAGLLRPGVGSIVNYRASYVQEVAEVIEQVMSNGVSVNQICAFVQNDAYGMAGVQGIKRALINRPRSNEIVAKLDEILEMSGPSPERNGIGPVGVYERNTLSSREGYDSLKQWEKTQQTPCRLVVTVGAYSAIGRFAGYARYKGEKWVISAVSFTGADNLAGTLQQFGVKDGFVMTQVVPLLDTNLPIVIAAKKKLGDNFGYVSLEGFIVGKMFLQLLNDIDGPITRTAFLNATRNSTFDLGGISIDFRNDNQGSDLVTAIQYYDKNYHPLASQDWARLFN